MDSCSCAVNNLQAPKPASGTHDSGGIFINVADQDPLTASANCVMKWHRDAVLLGHNSSTCCFRSTASCVHTAVWSHAHSH